jgi:hypothetical protein
LEAGGNPSGNGDVPGKDNGEGDEDEGQHCDDEDDPEPSDDEATTQIEVRKLYGDRKRFTLHVELSDTVKSIKAIIQNKEKIGRNDQRLIFQGVDLEDARTLVDYDVVDGSVLDLRPRARGGAKKNLDNEKTKKLKEYAGRKLASGDVLGQTPLEEEVRVFCANFNIQDRVNRMRPADIDRFFEVWEATRSQYDYVAKVVYKSLMPLHSQIVKIRTEASNCQELLEATCDHAYGDLFFTGNAYNHKGFTAMVREREAALASQAALDAEVERRIAARAANPGAMNVDA